MCTQECQILTDYGNQFEWINNNSGFYTVFGFSILFIAAIYFVLFMFSPWSLISIPFVWGGAFLITRYFDTSIHVGLDGIFQYILYSITLPAVAMILSIIIPLGSYVDKYGPHSR